MRLLGRSLLVTAGMLLLAGAGPVSAAAPRLATQAPIPYKRWSYPAQIPTGPIEAGNSPVLANAGSGFLTLPFLGPHFVTSIFDHCNPTYVPDGRVCRFDGQQRTADGFDDPNPGGKDYLFYDGHDGMDYGLYYENVIAAADGQVVFAAWDNPGCAKCGFGQNVFIDHGNGILTRYAHLERIDVQQGQRVRRGQVIGQSGNTGSSTGEHVHFGVYLAAGRIAIDPYGWAGAGPDPWPKDIGNLWLGGAPRFPAVTLPQVAVSAQAQADDATQIDVSWSSPGGGRFDVQVVRDGAPSSNWLSAVAAGGAHFSGQPGHLYSFLVTVKDDLGWAATAISSDILAGRLSVAP
jgi:murein DD-endopeptidase MepM/ murein hydrolase activator NlpD